MKHLSWRYVAGFVDGEGCIDVQIIRSVHICPRVRVALAEAGKDVIDLLHNNYGGAVYKRISKNPNWSDSYSWELCNYTNVCKFLRNIVNHLIIKKEQARFCLWMESNIKDKRLPDYVRESIRSELKAMKRDPHRLSERAQDSILSLL